MMEMEEPSSSSGSNGNADDDQEKQQSDHKHTNNDKTDNNDDDESDSNPGTAKTSMTANTGSTTSLENYSMEQDRSESSDPGAMSVNDLLSHYDGESNTAKLLRDMRKSYKEKGRLSIRDIGAEIEKEELEEKKETSSTGGGASATSLSPMRRSNSTLSAEDQVLSDDRKESNKLFYKLLGMTHDEDDQHQSTGENTTPSTPTRGGVQHFGDREMKILIAETPELWSIFNDIFGDKTIVECQHECRQLATFAAMELASGKIGHEAMKAKISRKQFHKFRMEYVCNPSLENRIYFFQCGIFAKFEMDPNSEDNLDGDEMKEFLDDYYCSDFLLMDVSKKGYSEDDTEHLKLPEREPFKQWLYEHCHKNKYGELSLRDIRRFVLVKKAKKPKQPPQPQKAEEEEEALGVQHTKAEAAADAILQKAEGAHTATIQTESNSESVLAAAAATAQEEAAVQAVQASSSKRDEILRKRLSLIVDQPNVDAKVREEAAMLMKRLSVVRENSHEAQERAEHILNQSLSRISEDEVLSTEEKDPAENAKKKDEDGWGGCLICEWIEGLMKGGGGSK